MGGSAKPGSGYDKETTAGDIVALIQHLGHRAAFVAGHDIGASVGYHLAASRPATVRRLATLDLGVPDASWLDIPMLPATDEQVAVLAKGRGGYPWWYAFNQLRVGGRAAGAVGADPGRRHRSVAGDRARTWWTATRARAAAPIAAAAADALPVPDGLAPDSAPGTAGFFAPRRRPGGPAVVDAAQGPAAVDAGHHRCLGTDHRTALAHRRRVGGPVPAPGADVRGPARPGAAAATGAGPSGGGHRARRGGPAACTRASSTGRSCSTAPTPGRRPTSRRRTAPWWC